MKQCAQLRIRRPAGVVTAWMKLQNGLAPLLTNRASGEQMLMYHRSLLDSQLGSKQRTERFVY